MCLSNSLESPGKGGGEHLSIPAIDCYTQTDRHRQTVTHFSARVPGLALRGPSCSLPPRPTDNFFRLRRKKSGKSLILFFFFFFLFSSPLNMTTFFSSLKETFFLKEKGLFSAPCIKSSVAKQARIFFF